MYYELLGYTAEESRDAAICAEGDFHETTRGVISPLGVASTTLRVPVDEYLTERAATLAEVFHDAVRALNPPLAMQIVVIDEANMPEFWYCAGAASSRSHVEICSPLPLRRHSHGVQVGERLSDNGCCISVLEEIGRSGRGGERVRAHARGDELTKQVLELTRPGYYIIASRTSFSSSLAYQPARCGSSGLTRDTGWVDQKRSG
ncbi:hypothetical protein DFH07DRAFT_1067832 [Mycena maculata]|uniref:Uncharacterized protein n=1 Tax=Mycena maculata TaxID=230809 RepID=A0AAD7HFU5_9AGAR|nr:hypothetical protein DFH07DRAFT_1067832 [Mycena maculata]